MSTQRIYIAIDLKSFYASVECVERGLDPLDTNLVVADANKTEKTICLAVTPSLKDNGVPGRPRLFEVEQAIKKLNYERQRLFKLSKFNSSSCIASELIKNPNLGIDYIIAPPRMAFYLDYSTRIYQIYLKYFASEDIDIYSIDEVFIDATEYLATYRMTAQELTMKIIKDVLDTTGITATAGIGTNLYLAKIAMDVVAKHVQADENGVRIATLNEHLYREILWSHRPICDFWRVGKGYAKRLEALGIYTMGDIARCSLGTEQDYYNSALLYKTFGVNAELLIDHAWGYEPVTMKDIKQLRPERKSLGEGQVLECATTGKITRIIVREMAEQLALNLLSKKYLCKKLVLTVGYDIENLKDPFIKSNYKGPIVKDAYGRDLPKAAHGTFNLEFHTASQKLIGQSVEKLFDRIYEPMLYSRRINLAACDLIKDGAVPKKEQAPIQLDLFESLEQQTQKKELVQKDLEREKKLQQAMLNIKNKYGKNAILKATDLQEGATAIKRNSQIGGHKA